MLDSNFGEFTSSRPKGQTVFTNGYDWGVAKATFGTRRPPPNGENSTFYRDYEMFIYGEPSANRRSELLLWVAVYSKPLEAL